MLNVIVLGAAAGGGVPQWNCGCVQCVEARRDTTQASNQASLALSADGENWFLVNAAPDLRQQLNATPALHPRALRHTPIAGVVLANGEVDAVAGLLTLREKTGFTLYAHRAVLDILDANPLFEVLDRKLVRRDALPLDATVMLALPDGTPSGLELTAFRVDGKVPLYLEGVANNDDGQTLGLEFRSGERRVLVVPACAAVDETLRQRLDGADLVFFDGTLWRDDELIELGLGSKTGARMGHLSMSGPLGAMAALDGLDVGQSVFLHINNSNPAWSRGSPQRAQVEAKGWIVPHDGMEFRLQPA